MASNETANERFERLAEQFRCETGLLAPGKDDALGHHDYDVRLTRWRDWLTALYSQPDTNTSQPSSSTPASAEMPEWAIEKLAYLRECNAAEPYAQSDSAALAILLADRVESLTREVARLDGLLHDQHNATDQVWNQYHQLRARAERAERERDALRELALNSYEKVQLVEGELMQYLACHILNWNDRGAPECGFRVRTEDDVIIAFDDATSSSTPEASHAE